MHVKLGSQPLPHKIDGRRFLRWVGCDEIPASSASTAKPDFRKECKRENGILSGAHSKCNQSWSPRLSKSIDKDDSVERNQKNRDQNLLDERVAWGGCRSRDFGVDGFNTHGWDIDILYFVPDGDMGSL